MTQIFLDWMYLVIRRRSGSKGRQYFLLIFAYLTKDKEFIILCFHWEQFLFFRNQSGSKDQYYFAFSAILLTNKKDNSFQIRNLMSSFLKSCLLSVVDPVRRTKHIYKYKDFSHYHYFYFLCFCFSEFAVLNVKSILMCFFISHQNVEAPFQPFFQVWIHSWILNSCFRSRL